MTIRTTIGVRALNDKLNLIDACAENAPEGTYDEAKQVREIIGDMADEFMRRLQTIGLDTPNCDQIREVEAVMYGYVRDANPLVVATAEGFGEAMDGPARANVIAGATRDRDFLAGLRS